MPKLPQLTGAELVRRLRRLGMVEDHTKGSHVVMRNTRTEGTSVVPVHGGGVTVKKGTLSAILKQLSITVEQLIDA